MDQYASRKYIIGALIAIIGLTFIIRLLYLQVVNSNYKLSAESNSRRMEIVYPARGLIFDRNKELIVHNQPAYDLKVTINELEPFDTAQLCDILEISASVFRQSLNEIISTPRKRRDPIVKLLSPKVYGRFKEKQYLFPGFYFSERTLRKYKHDVAPHLLGYIREVDSNIVSNKDYYEAGDYNGTKGVEQSYEKFLRGEKGRRYKQIDVRGYETGPYKDGKYDYDAISGKDITLTIDVKLQEYGERLMNNYKGSIVAIEPASGEVIAFVSAPKYSPSSLVGRKLNQNFKKLATDTLNPLFNYGIMAQYPPGSTFKPVNALIALDEGVIRTSTKFSCNHGYYARGVSMKCHTHDSPLELVDAICTSCNAYLAYSYKRIIDNNNFESSELAYVEWRRYLSNFGFGSKLGIDLPSEKPGFIPKPEFYDRIYGRNHWKAHTIISMAIGQGEVLTTPLQIANLAAIIANRGYYIIPHVVKDIESIDTLSRAFQQKHRAGIDTSYFNPIIEGMDKAVNTPKGTAMIARLNDIVLCGKTGTAENPHGIDHSVFMAFAPKDNPKIAISVYVEHGEWGASYAAPIASLMIEKYLTDTIARNRKWVEQRMLTRNLINPNANDE